MSDSAYTKEKFRKKVKEYIVEVLKNYGIEDVELADKILSKSTLEEDITLKKFVNDIVATKILSSYISSTPPSILRKNVICEEIIGLLRRKYEIEIALSRLDEKLRKGELGNLDYEMSRKTLVTEISKIEERLRNLIMG
ncbi:MAG: hypothetical protein DRJ38_10015 [Thermoprotei archaeon]|nr:MAG: hypothetical protein DRJ38_10015 [Thermoprotei archaeon]